MSTIADAASGQDFGSRISGHNLAALWEIRRGVDLTQPKSPARSAIWRYDEIRPAIMEAGDIVTAREAFRRVLVLENPAMRGQSRITNTLYAGLQLVRPGEVAPCHRHSQTALRFVIEGHGAYTAVEGERTILHPGDFVITPNWTWHDHGNDSGEPVVWLDGLDTPLVDLFDTVFREFHEQESFPVGPPEGDSPARFGAGMLPVGYEAATPSSPVFNYAYARSRAALDAMREADEWDPCHGLKMAYINPLTGGPPTPTIGAFLQLLPNGFETAPYRSTDGMVYCAVEGSGCTIVEGEAFEWGPRDIFVVPGWRRHRHRVDGDAVLFSFSDRPAQQALGLWREQRGGNSDPSG